MTRLARIPSAKQLLPVPLATPGHRGLNLQQQQSILPPEWATEAQNAVIDTSGRIAARLGINTTTTTPATGAPPVKTIFEQRTSGGTGTTIIAYDGDISTSVTNPSANSIAGTAPVGNGSWHFANFNDKVIGFQSGNKIIVRSVGNFATVVESAGTAPTGGVGTAAYGRIWQVDADGHTIKYSALLDETTWGSGNGDAGQFDMAKIWPQGTDDITALAAFNHNMVVFGRRQIVFLGSPNVSALGLDVTTLGVIDVVEGTGCVSQHTVQRVGDTDMVWLSPIGVQSMQRLLVQRSRPVQILSKYVRDTLLTQLQSEIEDGIRGVYSPTKGFYLLSFPVSNQTWVVDLRYKWTDADGDTVAPITRWTLALTAMFELQNRTLYTSGIAGGTVATYMSGTDNGNTYRFIFKTPWLDLGQDYAARLKILKRIGSIILVRSAIGIIYSWFTDFAGVGGSNTVTSQSIPTSEWGIGQWNIDSWSGGTLLQLLHTPANVTGQYFQFQIQADTSVLDFAVQQISIFAKLGRLAGQ